VNNQRRAIINGIIIGIIAIVVIGFILKPGTKNLPQPIVSGQALIGGDFALTDDTGVRRTNVDFANNYMLIYFGYSFCPDVCPMDLQKISMALSTLENDMVDISSLQPLFITIDPERDTPAMMNEYLENFHPKILGLSGSLEDIKLAAKAYRVYFSKGVVDEDGSYLMDHSSIIYFMGKNGEFLRHFSPTEAPQSIANGIKAILANE
jgi:protein SCO1/2